MVVYGVQLAIIVLLRLRLMQLNSLKRRAQLERTAAQSEGTVERIEHKHAFDDLTDKENPDCEHRHSLRDCIDLVGAIADFLFIRLS